MRFRRATALPVPRGRRPVVVMLVMFAAVIAAALAHVSLRLAGIRMGYSISEKTRERRTLEEEGRRLRLELSMLRSPERVEQLAREQLGMVRPDPGRIRVVRLPATEPPVGAAEKPGRVAATPTPAPVAKAALTPGSAAAAPAAVGVRP